MTVRITMATGYEKHINSNEFLEKLGVVMEEDAKSNAPVDTAELRESIFHEVHDGVLIVGATAEHASEVELGTSRQQAQPYLRPSLLQKREIS